MPCGMVTGSTLYKPCASNQSCYSFMNARTMIQRHKGPWPRHEKHFTAPLTIPGLLHLSSSSSVRGPGPGRKHNILPSTPPLPKKIPVIHAGSQRQLPKLHEKDLDLHQHKPKPEISVLCGKAQTMVSPRVRGMGM